MHGDTYDDFVDKFKVKKTTDDCYTPDNVMQAVNDWVANKYNINKSDFVRPFYPGGDYQHYDYSGGKIVVDNPPFSILSEIIMFYIDNNIKFFVFCPALTAFSVASSNCAVLAININIKYANGALVPTSFVTNLEPENVRVRTDSSLYNAIQIENDKNIGAKRKIPKYQYPNYIITAAKIGAYSKLGYDITIEKAESEHLRSMDAQKKSKKALYGGGYIVSDNVKQQIDRIDRIEKDRIEKDRIEKWQLSEREKEIINRLSSGGD